MRTERYEMGKGGGLVKIDVPANSLKNNLPAGMVLHWGGNMAWHAQDYAVVRRVAHTTGWGAETVSYEVISLEDFGSTRVEADSIKAESDPGVWHSQHFFLTERVLTGDEVLDLVEKNKAKVKADEEVKMASAEAHRKEIARLKAEHKDLLPLSETNQNHLTTAAKNVRKELAAKYPGVKFSVKTERYSGGDNLNVGWTDGPPSKEVDAIVDKYQGKDFDGMDDSTTYRHNAWIEVFGSAGYTFVSREVSAHFVHEAAALVLTRFAFKFKDGPEWPVGPEGVDLKAQFTEPTGGHSWDLGDVGRRLTAGANLTKGIERLDDDGGDYSGFFSYLLVGRK